MSPYSDGSVTNARSEKRRRWSRRDQMERHTPRAGRLSHDTGSRARFCASRTRRSMFPAQGAATAPESLPSRLRIVPSFRSILRNAVARAAGLDAWVALTSNASALATCLAISALVFASISPGLHTSAAPSCRNRHASPSVPAAGVDTQPRTGSQTSTVQAASSAHSASRAHGGAARVDVVVELVDVVVEVGRVVDVVVELVDVVVEVGRVVDVVVELVDVVAEAGVAGRVMAMAAG